MKSFSVTKFTHKVLHPPYADLLLQKIHSQSASSIHPMMTCSSRKFTHKVLHPPYSTTAKTCQFQLQKPAIFSYFLKRFYYFSKLILILYNNRYKEHSRKTIPLHFQLEHSIFNKSDFPHS